MLLQKQNNKIRKWIEDLKYLIGAKRMRRYTVNLGAYADFIPEHWVTNWIGFVNENKGQKSDFIYFTILNPNNLRVVGLEGEWFKIETEKELQINDTITCALFKLEIVR